MRRLLIVLALTVALFGVVGSAAYADSDPAAPDDGYIAPVCGDTTANTLAGVDCADVDGVPSLDPAEAADPPTVATLNAAATAEAATEPNPAELPAYCRAHVNVIFYTSSDWVRLGEKLLADASPCADYYITIPPLATDKTAPRCLQDDLIRALGPRFHPVGEFHFAGWDAWRRAAPGRTFADAAHAFEQKWGACGYDLWSLNEVHSGVRRNNGASRPNMRLLLNTLAAGGYGMPPGPGIAWVIGVGQPTLDVSDYKPQLENWLEDASFWQDMSNDIWAWGQEAYPDMRYWGVSDVSRHERTTNLSLFLEHFLLLGENGPAAVQPALDFLERAYVPLASAAWPQKPSSGFGMTDFGYNAYSIDQMERFVAEETFAVKHFSLSRPQLAPDSRIAFAYAPNNTCPDPDRPGKTKPCVPADEFAQLTAQLLERLASSIHYAYEQGDNSQAGACGPPGDHGWCSADIADAVFNPVWISFPSWNT